MTLALAYVFSFLAGPALLWCVARRDHGGWYFAALGVSVLVLTGFAYGVLYHSGPEMMRALSGLAALWCAWVIVLAMLLIALRRRLVKSGTRRLVFALIALATTLPWFGLVAARMISPL